MLKYPKKWKPVGKLVPGGKNMFGKYPDKVFQVWSISPDSSPTEAPELRRMTPGKPSEGTPRTQRISFSWLFSFWKAKLEG